MSIRFETDDAGRNWATESGEKAKGFYQVTDAGVRACFYDTKEARHCVLMLESDAQQWLIEQISAQATVDSSAQA